MRRSKLRAAIKLLRPRQWIKNLLLFAALIFSGGLTDPAASFRVFVGFLTFSLAAGAVYAFNDIRDRDEDRRHPVKRQRPLASGELQVVDAWLLLGVLVPLTVMLAIGLGWRFAAVVAVYLLLNAVYSLGLKRQVILDVFTVAAGFVLRAVAGAVLVPADPTPWLLVTTALLALFLGFSKRRHELLLLEGGAQKHRAVLSEYSTALLDQLIAVTTSATLVAYGIYCFTSRGPSFMLTLPFVAYGLFRYLYLVYRQDLGGSPEQHLLRDAPMLLTVVGWGVTVVLLLYLA